MHKAFPLLIRKFPLPEGTSHCLKKNATARRKVLPLPEVCTAIIVKQKPSIKDDRPALHEMTPATISSGLMPKTTSLTPFVPPSRNEWDLLFQPLFDELLAPIPSVDPPAPEVIAPLAKVIPPEHAESTGSPSSTTVDQDAPSPSKSQTTT
nr:hypothetical protein [Tanacetum cinerariifolium]